MDDNVRKVVPEAQEIMTFFGSTCAATEAVESYMRHEKRRCIDPGLKAVEVLRHEGACQCCSSPRIRRLL